MTAIAQQTGEGYVINNDFLFLADTQGWTFNTSGTDTGAWQPNDGSGSPGCLEVGSVSTGLQNFYWEWVGTWEQLGVPPGNTVTGATLANIDTKAAQFAIGAVATFGNYNIYSTDGSINLATLGSGRTVTTVDTAWNSASGSLQSIDSSYQASSTQVRLRIYGTIQGNGSSISPTTLRIDNYQLNVTSTGKMVWQKAHSSDVYVSGGVCAFNTDIFLVGTPISCTTDIVTAPRQVTHTHSTSTVVVGTKQQHNTDTYLRKILTNSITMVPSDWAAINFSVTDGTTTPPTVYTANMYTATAGCSLAAVFPGAITNAFTQDQVCGWKTQKTWLQLGVPADATVLGVELDGNSLAAISGTYTDWVLNAFQIKAHNYDTYNTLAPTVDYGAPITWGTVYPGRILPNSNNQIADPAIIPISGTYIPVPISQQIASGNNGVAFSVGYTLHIASSAVTQDVVECYYANLDYTSQTLNVDSNYVRSQYAYLVTYATANGGELPTGAPWDYLRWGFVIDPGSVWRNYPELAALIQADYAVRCPVQDVLTPAATTYYYDNLDGGTDQPILTQELVDNAKATATTYLQQHGTLPQNDSFWDYIRWRWKYNIDNFTAWWSDLAVWVEQDYQVLCPGQPFPLLPIQEDPPAVLLPAPEGTEPNYHQELAATYEGGTAAAAGLDWPPDYILAYRLWSDFFAQHDRLPINGETGHIFWDYLRWQFYLAFQQGAAGKTAFLQQTVDQYPNWIWVWLCMDYCTLNPGQCVPPCMDDTPVLPEPAPAGSLYAALDDNHTTRNPDAYNVVWPPDYNYLESYAGGTAGFDLLLPTGADQDGNIWDYLRWIWYDCYLQGEVGKQYFLQYQPLWLWNWISVDYANRIEPTAGPQLLDLILADLRPQSAGNSYKIIGGTEHWYSNVSSAGNISGGSASTNAQGLKFNVNYSEVTNAHQGTINIQGIYAGNIQDVQVGNWVLPVLTGATTLSISSASFTAGANIGHNFTNFKAVPGGVGITNNGDGTVAVVANFSAVNCSNHPVGPMQFTFTLQGIYNPVVPPPPTQVLTCNQRCYPVTAPAPQIAIYSTGVDNNHAVLPDGSRDPHYTITYSADKSITLGEQAWVCCALAKADGTDIGGGNNCGTCTGSNQGYGDYGYSATLPYSTPTRCIGVAQGSVQKTLGEYDYTTTFNSEGFIPASINITGYCCVDDGIWAITLNGNTIPNAVLADAGKTGNQNLVWTLPNPGWNVTGAINTLTFKCQNIRCCLQWLAASVEITASSYDWNRAAALFTTFFTTNKFLPSSGDGHGVVNGFDYGTLFDYARTAWYPLYVSDQSSTPPSGWTAAGFPDWLWGWLITEFITCGCQPPVIPPVNGFSTTFSQPVIKVWYTLPSTNIDHTTDSCLSQLTSWQHIQAHSTDIAIAYALMTLDTSMSWATQGRVVDEYELLWNTLTLPYVNLQVSWNTLELVPTDLPASWNTRVAVNPSQIFSWNTRQAAYRQLQANWNTRWLVAQQGQFSWRDNCLVGINPQLIWNTHQLVAVQLANTWWDMPASQHMPIPEFDFQWMPPVCAVQGWNDYRFVELLGGEIIEPTAFEPDPATYRGQYYYNTTTNRLYTKVVVQRGVNGIIVAYWKGIN